MAASSNDEALRIGEVARRTGMSPPALRAWESRYGVLAPLRTAGGQRLYCLADVKRVQAVQALVAKGWSVVGAAHHVSADVSGEDIDPADRDDGGPAGEGVDRVEDAPQVHATWGLHGREAMVNRLASVDAYAVIVTYETSRAMLRATDPASVRDALVDLIERLGAGVGPAALQDDVVIPADISLGEGPPLLPRAPAASLARLRLEVILPLVLEDARLVVHRLQLDRLGRSIQR